MPAHSHSTKISTTPSTDRLMYGPEITFDLRGQRQLRWPKSDFLLLAQKIQQHDYSFTRGHGNEPFKSCQWAAYNLHRNAWLQGRDLVIVQLALGKLKVGEITYNLMVDCGKPIPEAHQCRNAQS